MGVWIEIWLWWRVDAAIMSLPAWECGLKFVYGKSSDELFVVTPCVGVWIEIQILLVSAPAPAVTPCVGVWIEIQPPGI